MLSTCARSSADSSPENTKGFDITRLAEFLVIADSEDGALHDLGASPDD